MEDFFYAGIAAVIKEIGDHLHKDALTGTVRVSGRIPSAVYDRNVIFEKEKPFKDLGGMLCCAVIRADRCNPETVRCDGRTVAAPRPRDCL